MKIPLLVKKAAQEISVKHEKVGDFFKNTDNVHDVRLWLAAKLTGEFCEVPDDEVLKLMDDFLDALEKTQQIHHECSHWIAAINQD